MEALQLPSNSYADPVQERIAKEVYGGKRYAKIYDHPVLDHERSEQYGRNCYACQPYISIRAKGVKDFTSRQLTEELKAEFPDAWERYLAASKEREGGRTLAKILPCLNEATWRELQELGRVFVDELADEVIPGLEEVCEQARMYMRLKKPRMRLVGGKLEEVEQ